MTIVEITAPIFTIALFLRLFKPIVNYIGGKLLYNRILKNI